MIVTTFGVLRVSADLVISPHPLSIVRPSTTSALLPAYFPHRHPYRHSSAYTRASFSSIPAPINNVEMSTLGTTISTLLLLADARSSSSNVRSANTEGGIYNGAGGAVVVSAMYGSGGLWLASLHREAEI